MPILLLRSQVDKAGQLGKRGAKAGNRVFEPEMNISYNQERFLVKELGHQQSHQTFDPQFLLPEKNVGQRTEVKRRDGLVVYSWYLSYLNMA